MSRSSRSIKLAIVGTASVALLGSVFLVNGCGDEGEAGAEQSWDENGQPVTHRRAGGGGFFFIPIPRIGGGFVGGGNRGPVMTAPSARGGFGATGSSSVGS